MYLRVGLCHPEYSIISASVLKVPSVVYGYDNGVVIGPGELEFIKAQVPLWVAGANSNRNSDAAAAAAAAAAADEIACACLTFTMCLAHMLTLTIHYFVLFIHLVKWISFDHKFMAG